MNEVAGWRRSSFCASESCVLVRRVGGMVQVAEEYRGNDKVWLVFTEDEWAQFVAGVKAGEFDGDTP